MRAKNLKQHNIQIDAHEDKDEWGDRYWMVNGIKWNNHELALKAAKEIVNAEFQERYKKGKK